MKFNKFLLLALALLLVATGCATKKFVRQEVAGSEARLNQAVKDGDARLQSQVTELSDLNKQLSSRLEQVSDRATAADAKAEEAKTIGVDARTKAEKADRTATEVRVAFDARNNFVPVETVHVLFGFNQAVLTTDGQAILERVAKMLAGNKNAILTLEGGTDSVGGAAYNFQLSERRVDSVIRYLVGEKNVDLNRIFRIGLGKSRPVADNKTADGRKQNRRVSIVYMEPK